MTAGRDFAKDVISLVRSDRPFQPQVSYDPDGDCIEFLAKPDASYAQRIDDLITVYYSQNSDEVTGCLIKGVTAFQEKMAKHFPNFGITVQDGRVRLTYLVLAHLLSAPKPPSEIDSHVYRKLLHVAEETGAEAQLSKR